MKVPFNINLSGKTAIVTGGSGTLCSAMAYGLAVCGAKVAIIGRNKEKLASVSEKLTKDALDEYNKNVIVKGYSCNVINKDELSAAYETIKNELGSCDILINGAGGNQPGAITSIEMLKKEKEDSDYSFWNLDEDRIRDVMDLNYMGTLLPIQVFTKDMVEKRSGSIINIASVVGLAPEFAMTVYGATKAFVLFLSQGLSQELAPKGVYVQAVLPAATRTEIWDRSGADINAMTGVMDVEELVDAALVGFDRRETITIPPLHKPELWAAFQQARQVMLPEFAQEHAAGHYRTYS